MSNNQQVFTLFFIPFDHVPMSTVNVFETIIEADRFIVEHYKRLSQLFPESFPKLPEIEGIDNLEKLQLYVDWLYDVQKSGAPFVCGIFRGNIGGTFRKIGFGFDIFEFIHVIWTHYNKEATPQWTKSIKRELEGKGS